MSYNCYNRIREKNRTVLTRTISEEVEWMALCTNCGAKVKGKFCSNCGTPLNGGESVAGGKPAKEYKPVGGLPKETGADPGLEPGEEPYPEIRPVQQPERRSGLLRGCLVIVIVMVVGILIASGIGFYLIRTAMEGGLNP